MHIQCLYLNIYPRFVKIVNNDFKKVLQKCFEAQTQKIFVKKQPKNTKIINYTIRKILIYYFNASKAQVVNNGQHIINVVKGRPLSIISGWHGM